MLATIELALEYHLECNLYPPISLDFIPDCITAINAVNDDNPGELITMVNGVELPAYAIVEQLNLGFFVE